MAFATIAGFSSPSRGTGSVESSVDLYSLIENSSDRLFNHRSSFLKNKNLLASSGNVLNQILWKRVCSDFKNRIIVNQILQYFPADNYMQFHM